MATPSILVIVIGNWLECSQDGREEGRRGRRGLNLWEAVCVTFILAKTHTGANKQSDMLYPPPLSLKDKSKHTHAHVVTRSK